MIDEYEWYREYILDMLRHVEDLEYEMECVLDNYQHAMYEIFYRIKPHRRVEKEVGYELNKIRGILEKMKETTKGMELGKYTIIEPWEKSPLGEIVKFEGEMTRNKMDAFSYGREKPWVLDWKSYETVLEEFLKYRKRVWEVLVSSEKLDGMLYNNSEDMFFGVIESQREMKEAEKDAHSKLDEMVNIMYEIEDMHNDEKDGEFVKLVPFSLHDYDNPRWCKIKKTM